MQIRKQAVFLGAIFAALMLFVSGCATPMPREDATSAWRVGPVVERQTTLGNDSLFALRPIYSHEQTSEDVKEFRSVTDILWPLGTVSRRDDRYYWRFLLFYGTGGAESRLAEGDDPYRFRLFPFFFAGRTIDDEPYAAVFPIGGTIRNFLVFSKLRFVLFPLYADGETADVEMRTVLWPIYLTRHGEHIDQFRLWPIYGSRERRGKYQTDRTEFALWPIWTSTHIEGETINGDGFVLFPIYGHSHYERTKRGEEESWMVLPPLFTYGRGDDGFRKLYAPWPFYRAFDRDDQHERHYWPIYGSVTNKHSVREYALWPFFQKTVTDDTLVRRTSIHAPLPFYFHFGAEASNPSSTNTVDYCYSRVWPLFSYRRNQGVTTTRFPELSLWSRSEPIERNWAPLWTLFSYRAKENGAYCTDILWGFVSWGRDSEEKRHFRLFWLFGTKPKLAEPQVERTE